MANRLVDGIMIKRRTKHQKSAIRMIEESVHILRSAPVTLLTVYYTGSIPFVLGLLYFWADMSRSADAHEHSAMAALGLSLLWEWSLVPRRIRQTIVIIILTGSLMLTYKEYFVDYGQEAMTAYWFEEAARDLGASEWQIFRDILVPYMRPGLIAGALLAFTLSLDDFVITFFTSGPDTVTFPVKVYSMVRFSVTPEVNAASAVLIAITLILTTTALWLQNRAEKRR